MTVEGGPIKFPPPDPPSAAHPVPDFRALTGNRPVARAELPDGSGAWLISSYEYVRQTVVDQRFSRALAVAPGRWRPGPERFAAGSLIGIDPPEHTRLRKLVASAFTTRRVEALRPRVAGIVDGLLDAILARLELQEAFRGLLARLPGLLVGPGRLSSLPTPVMDAEQVGRVAGALDLQQPRVVRAPEAALPAVARLARRGAARWTGTPSSTPTSMTCCA